MKLILEFIYILTMFISVAAFSVHMTVRVKGLSATSKIAKQNSTTAFLLIVLMFNLSDFIIIYMNKIKMSPDLEWIYVFENILEVILIYAMIRMERDYAGVQLPRFTDTLTAVICMLLIYFDGVYEWGDSSNDTRYFIMMIAINAVPIVILAVYSIKFFATEQSIRGKGGVSKYLIVFNIFCVFLCAVCTLSNADQQTRHQFVVHSKEYYEIIWLVFNIMTFSFVWRTINTTVISSAKEEMTTDERIELIKKEFDLSDRETDIARLILEGHNNKEIAASLYLSPNTVKVHASNLYHKLGAANRVQAVQIIRDHRADSEKNND